MLDKVVNLINHRLKLSPKDREKIRKAKVRGTVDLYELAVKYEVSLATIYRIRKAVK